MPSANQVLGKGTGIWRCPAQGAMRIAGPRVHTQNGRGRLVDVFGAHLSSVAAIRP